MANDIESLFLTHRARVYRWALGMCRNHADSLDAVQEVFVRMMRTTPVFADERAIVGWLRRVTASVVLDRWRTHAAAAKAVAGLRTAGDAKHDAPIASVPDADQRETAQQVSAALAQLSEQQRLVVLAKIFDQLTFEQVAAELGIGVPTAKTHYLRALAALRDRLSAGATHAGDLRNQKMGGRHELSGVSRATG